MFPGFNRKKRGSISKGDWDRDGVPNRKDCDALNWKKQDGGEVFISERFDDDQVTEQNQKLMKSYAKGERELIKERLEFHRLKRKRGGK